MHHLSRIVVLPATLLLCALAACVVEGPPPPRQVVVERPAPVYVAPPGPEVVVRP
jgi:hypothetical protein